MAEANLKELCFAFHLNPCVSPFAMSSDLSRDLVELSPLHNLPCSPGGNTILEILAHTLSDWVPILSSQRRVTSTELPAAHSAAH
jgi:hypothetical protein